MISQREPFKTISEVRDYLSGDKVQCLICGRWFKALNPHIYKAHGIHASDYKDTFGIPSSYGLSSMASKEKRAASMIGKPLPPKTMIYHENGLPEKTKRRMVRTLALRKNDEVESNNRRVARLKWYDSGGHCQTCPFRLAAIKEG